MKGRSPNLERYLVIICWIALRIHPKVKAECLRLLATLRLDPARTRLISGFVDTYLRLSQQEEQVFQEEVGKLEETEQASVIHHSIRVFSRSPTRFF